MRPQEDFLFFSKEIPTFVIKEKFDQLVLTINFSNFNVKKTGPSHIMIQRDHFGPK
jgi:hypothetical protein